MNDCEGATVRVFSLRSTVGDTTVMPSHLRQQMNFRTPQDHQSIDMNFFAQLIPPSTTGTHGMPWMS